MLARLRSARTRSFPARGCRELELCGVAVKVLLRGCRSVVAMRRVSELLVLTRERVRPASPCGAPLHCLVRSVPRLLRGLFGIVPGLLSVLLVRRNFFARNFALVG